MFEIAEDGERVLDQLVRPPALDVRNKADTAGILVARGIIKTLRRRQSRIRAVAKAKRSPARRDPLTSSLCTMSCRAHPCPRLSPAQTPRERLLLGASLASAAPIGVTAQGHRWSLAAFSLPRFGSGAYGRPCQAAPRCPMAPLITVQCGRDDKPAAEHQTGRQLGQQYCPTLPCQILIMNARVRLSRKSTFAFEVSSSVPKKPSEQVRARAPEPSSPGRSA